MYDWCNPGVGQIRKPSESPSMQSLALAVAFNRSDLYSCPGTLLNTHWSCWPNVLL